MIDDDKQRENLKADMKVIGLIVLAVVVLLVVVKVTWGDRICAPYPDGSRLVLCGSQK